MAEPIRGRGWNIAWRTVRPLAIFLCACVLVLGILATAWTYLYEHYLMPPDPTDTTAVEFVVKRGSSVSSIAKQLKEGSKILLTAIFPYANKSPLCLSILSTVRRYTQNTQNPDWFSMGIRFIRWAYLENYSTWNSIPDDNGIPPLSNWVFQVMANRKRGQEA